MSKARGNPKLLMTISTQHNTNVLTKCFRPGPRLSDRVLEQVTAWQSRPLDTVYPIVYLDCIVLKIREGMRVVNKAIYLALGVNMDGHKDLLGLWMSENEGAKFWVSVLTELKNRGVKDILIACVDGLKGFPDAIAVEYPQTRIQLCIVHMVRNSLKYVSWKDYKAVTRDLKQIYQATTEDQALAELDRFGKTWDFPHGIVYISFG